MQPLPAFMRRACGQFSAKRLHLGLEAIATAAVVADQVKHGETAPELLAVRQLMHDGRMVRRVVFPYDDEGSHAQTDQAAGHALQRDQGNRQDLPDGVDAKLHVIG